MSNFDELDLDGIAHELENGGGAYIVDDAARLTHIVNAVPQTAYQDPLQAELARLRLGAEKAGVSDEFYQLVETQILRMREINRQSVSVGNPLSATDKNLGGSAVLTSSTKVVQKSVARWQGLDAETGPVTITLGPVTPIAVDAPPPVGVITPNAVIRPFAYVRWGTYGCNFTAEVDIGTGRQLSVCASMVEVEVALDALSTVNNAQANLAACLSFKSPMRTNMLIRTRYLDSMVQNTPTFMALPPFAIGILPIQMSDTSGAVQIDFYDASSTLRYSIIVNNGSQMTPIPLAGDIVGLGVTSTTVTTQHVRLPFELSI